MALLTEILETSMHIQQHCSFLDSETITASFSGNLNGRNWSSMDLSTTYGVIGFVLLTYLLLVRFLRLRKVNKESAYFSLLYPDESSFYRMTNDHAHHIIRYLQQYEFPFAFEASLAASLFRPYGIPSISRVLAKSGQFADVSTGSKRTADTAVLVVDAGQNPPESEKCCAAISRMNYSKFLACHPFLRHPWQMRSFTDMTAYILILEQFIAGGRNPATSKMRTCCIRLHYLHGCRSSS